MGCFIFGSGGGRGGGPDFSQVTMEPRFGLSGKKFFDKNGELKAGTILNWDGTPLSLSPGEELVGSPHVVNPSLSRRYIPAGRYLGENILLSPMPQGAVEMELWDETGTVHLTKTAGYIGGGTENLVLPQHIGYSISPDFEDQFLLTKGKFCTQHITVRRVQVVETTVLPTSSSTIIIPYYLHPSGPRVPIQISFCTNVTASGYVIAGFFNRNDDYMRVYKLGTGFCYPDITITQEPDRKQMRVVLQSGYSFRTGVDYTICFTC